MYNDFLNEIGSYQCILFPKVYPRVKIKKLRFKKLKTKRTIYKKKLPIVKATSVVELKFFFERFLTNVEGYNYHGQYMLKNKNNGLPHLENPFNKYIRYFNRNGSLLKYRALICRSLEKFGRIMVSKSNDHIKDLPLSAKGQIGFLYYSTHSRSANSLFNWWASAHNHYFTFKIIKPTKFLKKRKKAKNKIMCVKLPKTAHLSYPLKFLNLYSEEINLRRIEDRITQSIINTFITFSDNPIRNRRARSFLVALRKPSSN